MSADRSDTARAENAGCRQSGIGPSGSGPLQRVAWRLASPHDASSHSPGGTALAVFEIVGDIEAAFAALGIKPVVTGAVALRSLGGIDQAVVAKPAPDLCMIFPHGGGAVIRAIAAWLTTAGLLQTVPLSALHNRLPSGLRPEAADAVESMALDLLDRAVSPLALTVLLDQPRRWREHEQGRLGRVSRSRQVYLHRLLAPPLVVALGPPNVGKSSLLNALARERLAVVADLPGTTRDAVGVRLDIEGLVVRYTDTPGIVPGLAGQVSGRAPLGPFSSEIDVALQAQTAALALIPQADLILSCGDPVSGFLDLGALDFAAAANTPVVRALLRSDLLGSESGLGKGRSAGNEGTAAVSISLLDPAEHTFESSGLRTLASLIRETLLPESCLADPGAWPFWEA